ncbi:MAG: cytochrome c biogenesis protein CcsA [bacterium]|nr:cytochrome c biogenesis protein CcsA [bacterium]
MPVIGPTLRALGSLWLAAVLLVLLLVAMGCATVVESTDGTERALADFYLSWWFQGLLALLAVNVATALVVRYPFNRRQIGFVATHSGILITLGGALVTSWWSIDGQLGLAEGDTSEKFNLPGLETLTVTNRQDSQEVKTILTGRGIGKPRATDRTGQPEMSVGDLTVRFEQYLPDGQWVRNVTDDGTAPNPAVEVLLADPQHQHSAWLFAGGDSTELGHQLEATFRVVKNAAELAELLAPLDPADADDASAGSIRVELAGSQFAMPIEQCSDRAVPLGDTGYTVQVLRYLPHATVGPNNKVVTASNRPENPAVEVEFTGSEGKSTRVAFAKFPDFRSMHGREEHEDIKLTFVAGKAPAGSGSPIELLAGPDDRLFARFQPPGADLSTRELTVGTATETPWPGRKLTVLRRFDRARAEWTVEPVEPPRETRMPALLLDLSTPEQTNRMWVQKFRPRPVTVDGVPYQISYGIDSRDLGFVVKLNRFHIAQYPGTMQPRSFESHVTITEADGTVRDEVISMNNPAKVAGYTLFQSSYDQRGRKPVSYLSVARDPGLPIVFAGYIVMMAGMAVVLVTRMLDRRRLKHAQDGGAAVTAQGVPHGQTGSAKATNNGKPDRQVAARSGPTEPAPTIGRSSPAQRPTTLGAIGLLGVIATLASCANASAAELPTSLDLEAIRAVPVQNDGRWQPLDTLARDMVASVTGSTVYQEHDPVAVLLAWTFEPRHWANHPLIEIGNAELRSELDLPADQTVFSYIDLINHRRLREIIGELANLPKDQKPDPLQSKASDINGKLGTLQRIFGNDTIRLIPDPDEYAGAWRPIPFADEPAARHRDATHAEAAGAWAEVRRAFLADDASAFAAACNNLVAGLDKLPAAHRPTADLIATELRYNRLHPFRTSWIVMIGAAVLAGLATLIRRRWFDGLVFLGMVAGFALLSYGLWLRWQIAGRIPASNMFESLLFLSWGMGAFAIVAMCLVRHRVVPLTASALGAVALLVADFILPEAKHFIRPIPPVLADTVWMSIHVPVIMVSYSVLALAVLIAHAQLFVMAFAPARQRLAGAIDTLHYWYIAVGSLLLLIGILTGSMWAASSWGRYWGWDPKEVWSLVAFLGYMAILHVRVDHERVPAGIVFVGIALVAAVFALIGWNLGIGAGGTALALVASAVMLLLFVLARGHFATAVKSILAFWLIIMTYVGVNYVLGVGLHSYGFGTGAVAWRMLWVGGIDLAIVALCCMIHLARQWGPNLWEVAKHLRAALFESVNRVAP